MCLFLKKFLRQRRSVEEVICFVEKSNISICAPVRTHVEMRFHITRPHVREIAFPKCYAAPALQSTNGSHERLLFVILGMRHLTAVYFCAPH